MKDAVKYGLLLACFFYFTMQDLIRVNRGKATFLDIFFIAFNIPMMSFCVVKLAALLG